MGQLLATYNGSSHKKVKIIKCCSSPMYFGKFLSDTMKTVGWAYFCRQCHRLEKHGKWERVKG